MMHLECNVSLFLLIIYLLFTHVSVFYPQGIKNSSPIKDIKEELSATMKCF